MTTKKTMSEKRFRATLLGASVAGSFKANSAAVLDVPDDVFLKLEGPAQKAHILVQVRIGGMISQRLAETYVQQIADQLNQFDAANAAVAKLT